MSIEQQAGTKSFAVNQLNSNIKCKHVNLYHMHKFLKVKKLHFGETLKPAETQQSCNIAKFTLKAAGICEFFNVTAYLCVLYNRCLSFVAMFLEKYFSFFRLGLVRILFT